MQLPTSFPDPEAKPKWRKWALILLAVLLLHVAILLIHLNWNAPSQTKVDVNTIDSKTLEAIKKRWESREKKRLLLDKNPQAPSEKEAPADARYESARNIKVEKEQRARVRDVLNHPGAQAIQQQQEVQRQREERQTLLKKLRLPLDSTTPGFRQESEPMARVQPQQMGADQELLEDKLPEGAENLLNAQESKYYSFYSRIAEVLAPIWKGRVRTILMQHQIREGDYPTEVQVTFDHDGKIIDVECSRSSGVHELDEAAVKSWYAVGSVRNPPGPLFDASGTAKIGWSFLVRVGAGVGVGFSPVW